jgi:hypothetical protein
MDVFHTTRFIMKKFLVTALVAIPMLSSAATYDFSGLGYFWAGSSVVTKTYQGQITFDSSSPSSIYSMGDSMPVQQGFITTYSNAVQLFDIQFNDGTHLSGRTGDIVVNNIQQAEAGAQVPLGKSLQIYLRNITGNGFTNTATFAFQAVPGQFSQADFEAVTGVMMADLEAGQVLNPLTDPFIIGTDIPHPMMATFTNGATFRLNSSSSIQLDSFTPAVPEPKSMLLMLLGLPLILISRLRK